MYRVIVGAGIGYFFANLTLAIGGNVPGYGNLIDGLGGFSHQMLGPILIGAAIGWAWGNLSK